MLQKKYTLRPLNRRNPMQLSEQILYINQVVVENLFCDIQEAEYGRISNRIEHIASILPTQNDISIPQDPELLGKSALLDAEPRTELVDGDLAVAESVQNSYT